MKIAIVGCGAMGSIYAVLLSASGNNVTAIGRSEQRAARVREEGLRVSGASGDRTVDLRMLAQMPDETFDLVVVAVKATQIVSVAEGIVPLLHDHSVVLALQNGVGSADLLARHVPAGRLAVGIAGGFGAELVSPVHARHNGMQVIRFGPYSDIPIARLEQIADVWNAAGLKTEVAADITAMQWEKLICNVAYSAISALTGKTVGEIMDDPDLAVTSREAALEAWTVARANGVAMKVEDPVALIRAFGGRMPDARPSLLQDLEAGRPTEIDVINGAVPTFAQRAGTTAPVNATLVALVKARERTMVSHKA